MKKETDGSLFTFLSFLETGRVEANQALGELMCRYEAVLRRRCNRICARFPSLSISGDELTNFTFLRATERASTYKPLTDPGATSAEHAKYTSAWLFKIAQNLLFDLGRQTNRPHPYERNISEPSPIAPADVAALLVGANPGRFDSADKPHVARAFSTLPEKSQLVVTWTLDKQLRSPSGKYMNRGSLTELANRLGTTPANIRQIRKRAYDTIGKAVKRARTTNRRGR